MVPERARPAESIALPFAGQPRSRAHHGQEDTVRICRMLSVHILLACWLLVALPTRQLIGKVDQWMSTSPDGSGPSKMLPDYWVFRPRPFTDTCMTDLCLPCVLDLGYSGSTTTGSRSSFNRSVGRAAVTRLPTVPLAQLARRELCLSDLTNLEPRRNVEAQSGATGWAGPTRG